MKISFVVFGLTLPHQNIRLIDEEEEDLSAMISQILFQAGFLQLGNSFPKHKVSLVQS